MTILTTTANVIAPIATHGMMSSDDGPRHHPIPFVSHGTPTQVSSEFSEDGLSVGVIDKKIATEFVVGYHYLHRRPPISHAFGLFGEKEVVGVITFGTPPSRHAQKSVCPTEPGSAIELNRLWIASTQPKNTASYFVSRAMKLLPPVIVFSYADTSVGHTGYVYRACNFHYAGWTDMERKTPRFDYIPSDPSKHTRDAYRNGYVNKVRRKPKVKYWKATGNKIERSRLEDLCGWEQMDWKKEPPPLEHRQRHVPIVVP